MHRQLIAGIAISTLLVISSPAVGQTPGSADGGITVQDALEEPADLDDALDIRADNDPDDVGQLGLTPEGVEPPEVEAPPAGKTAPAKAPDKGGK